MKRLEVFLPPPPPGRDASPSQVTPQQIVRFPQQIAGTHLYSWVERGTVRVKCLAQEHKTVSPARARTWTARSGDERTNHEATAPPKIGQYLVLNYLLIYKISKKYIKTHSLSKIRKKENLFQSSK